MKRRDDTPGGDAAGKTDGVRLVDDGGAGFRTAGDDTQDPGERRYLGQRFGEGHGEARRDLAGLQQDGAAGGEGGHGVDESENQRHVPGADDADHGVGHESVPVVHAGHLCRLPALCLCGKCRRAPTPVADEVDGLLHLEVGKGAAPRVDGERLAELAPACRQRFAPGPEGRAAALDTQRVPGAGLLPQAARGAGDLVGGPGLDPVVDLAGARVRDRQGPVAAGAHAAAPVKPGGSPAAAAKP